MTTAMNTANPTRFQATAKAELTYADAVNKMGELLSWAADIDKMEEQDRVMIFGISKALSDIYGINRSVVDSDVRHACREIMQANGM